MNEQDRENSIAWLKRVESNFGNTKYVLSICSFIEIICYIGIIYFIADVLSGIIYNKDDVSILIERIPFLILFIVIRSFSKFLRQKVAYKAVLISRKHIQNILLETLRRNKRNNEQDTAADNFSSIFIESIKATEGYFGKFVPQKIEALIFGLSILVAVSFYNLFCTLLLILTIPTIPVFSIIIGKGVVEEQKKQFGFMANMGAYFADRVKGIATLKRFGFIDDETAKIKILSKRYNKGLSKILKKAFLAGGFIEFFASASIATIAIFIGLSLTGYITLAQYPVDIDYFVGLFILLLIPEFYRPLQKLSNFYHDKREAMGAASHLLQYLSIFPDDDNATIVQASHHKIYDFNNARLIDIDNITFKYKVDSPYVFHNFSLQIFKNEWLGIQGPSGSGKSTLAALIMNVLQPTSGKITFFTEHTALEKINMGWVKQKAELFYGSIASNIALSKNPERQKVKQMLDDLQLCSFINQLPSGIDTVIGYGGHKLSGGQEQQISIARALFIQPEILILDEPFAHLDQVSTSQLLKNLALIKGKTTIVQVSHDNQHLKYADRIHILNFFKDED